MTLLELLTRIDGAKSQKERGELLKQNQNHHLENLLWYTFHPDVKFLLPEGAPPYQAQADDPMSTMMYGQIRKLRYFIHQCSDPQWLTIISMITFIPMPFAFLTSSRYSSLLPNRGSAL